MKRIILTERQFSELILLEDKHFPLFLKPLMIDATSFVKKAIDDAIKYNHTSWNYIMQTPECDYTENIVFNVSITNIENAGVNDYEAYYIGNYINPVKEKFDYITIKLIVPVNTNSEYNPAFIDMTIFHEVEHMYDDWMRQINNGYASIDDKVENNIINLFDDIEKNYKDNKFLMGVAGIAYLSIKDEEKAFLTQTYTELQRVNCTRFNYQEKIKETYSYKQYNDIIKNKLPLIKTSSIDDLNLLITLCKNYKENNIPKFNGNYSQYRNKLIKWGEFTAHQFIKKFGGILTQYLEDNIKGKK